MKILSLLLLLTFTLFSFTTQLKEKDGLTLHSFQHNGIERTYYLHFPKNFDKLLSVPLLMALHGGGKGDGEDIAKNFGFNRIADREGFLAIYPNGIDNQWNDGRGKTSRRRQNIDKFDDVGFLSSLIDTLIKNYGVDPEKVFATGASNGGMMSFKLGCEITSKLAAIAPVIANIPKNIVGNCKPDFQLPVLIMNGTEDPLVPWNGGTVKFWRVELGEVISTESSVRFWVEHNKCFEKPVTVTLPDVDDEDDSYVKVVSYKNKEHTSDVILYAVIGGGHNIPGGDTPDVRFLVGNKNNDVNAAEEIWKFFKSVLAKK